VAALEVERQIRGMTRHSATVLAFALSFAAINSVGAQTRRALLIGINTYQYPTTTLASWRHNVVPAPSSTVLNDTPIPRGAIPNLHGAVADARAIEMILRTRYEFTQTVRLEDSAATRAGILRAVQRLVDETRAGDVVTFFYSGHGSQRLNTLAPASATTTQMDQTIVPADANAGQYDIRNIELSMLFVQILDKGARLTLIFDSCHSGSAVRSATIPGTFRAAVFDTRDARDSTNILSLASSRRTNRALFLAAAEEDQLAEEELTVDPVDHEIHGAFTDALLSVIRNPTTSVNAPAQEIFEQAQAVLRWRGRTQVPVLDGAGADARRPLFGLDTDARVGRITLAAQGTRGDTVILDGGLAVGIGGGSELHSEDGIDTLRLRIVGFPDLVFSKAVRIGGTMRPVSPGTLFVLDKAVSSAAIALRAWIPPTITQAQLRTSIASFKRLRESKSLEWWDDPAGLPDDGRPLYVVSYNGRLWTVQAPNGRIVQLATPEAAATTISSLRDMAEGRGSSVPPKPSRRAPIPAASERPTPRVYILIPPTQQLLDAIGLGKANGVGTINAFAQRDSGEYALFGRLRDTTVSYAWVRPNSTIASQSRSPLPARTDWISIQVESGDRDSAAGVKLNSFAAQLARVTFWLSVNPPYSRVFPYRLGLKGLDAWNTRVRLQGDTAPLVGGEQYALTLQKDHSDHRLTDSAFVYVFSIDSAGADTLLFGVSRNLFPTRDITGHVLTPDVITLPVEPFIMCAPYGAVTFIMVVSSQPISNPSVVFNHQGVVTSTRDGTPASALPPSDWLVQRLIFQSKPPGPSAPSTAAAKSTCN
jgi:hypothetical protein